MALAAAGLLSAASCSTVFVWTVFASDRSPTIWWNDEVKLLPNLRVNGINIAAGEGNREMNDGGFAE